MRAAGLAGKACCGSPQARPVTVACVIVHNRLLHNAIVWDVVSGSHEVNLGDGVDGIGPTGRALGGTALRGGAG